MQVGFAVIGSGADVEVRLFGLRPDDPLSLLRFHRTGEGLAVLLGRLCYRDDLLATLPPRAAQDLAGPGGSNDAALALAVYTHQGLAGLTRLEGDFALVLWDAREQLLLGVRDPLGGYPLFWAQGRGGTGLASGLRPLL